MKGQLKQIRMLQKKVMISPRKPSKEWDNRFHLNKIPDYNVMNDEHCINYVDNLICYGKSFKNKPHAVLAPGGIRAMKHQPSAERMIESSGSKEGRAPSALKKENIVPYRRQNFKGVHKRRIPLATITSYEEELRGLLEKDNIEKYYIDAFMDSIQRLQPNMLLQIVGKEIENLRNNKSVLQQLRNSIDQREKTIEDLKQYNDMIGSYEIALNIKERCRVLLERLRLVSLEVIEYLIGFRKLLKDSYYMSGDDKKIEEAEHFPLLVRGANYLLQMKQDTSFLYYSNIGKFFKFSEKADPFLVSPSNPYIISKGASKRKQFEALKARSKQYMDLPILPGISKKINEAEMMIMNESIAHVSMVKEQSNSPSLDNKPSPFYAFEEKNDDQSVEDIKAPSIVHTSSFNNPSVCTEPSLAPLKLSTNEINGFLEYYQTQLHPFMLKSYCELSSLVSKAQQGHEAYWLCYATDDISTEESKKYSHIKGLAVFFIDPASALRVRVTILHASLVQSELSFETFLKQVVDYIWNNVHCSEIRVGLAHLKQGEDLYTPYDILKTAYSGLKFRWKTLTNDDSENRILVLGANRPEDKIFLNPRNIIEDQLPIMFKQAVVLLLTNTLSKPNDETSELCPLGHCGFLDAFQKLQKAEQISDFRSLQLVSHKSGVFFDDYLNEAFDALNSKPEISLVACKSVCTADYTQFEELLKSQEYSTKFPESSLYCACIQSIELKWRSYDLIQHNRIKYVRVRGNIMLSESEDYTVVIIETDDESTSAMIFCPKKVELFRATGYYESIVGVEY